MRFQRRHRNSYPTAPRIANNRNRAPRYQVLVDEDGSCFVIDTEEKTPLGLPKLIGEFDNFINAIRACTALNNSDWVVVQAHQLGLEQNLLAG